MTGTPDNSFGFRAVAPDERRAQIRRVFTGVAPRYDLMNDLMSFGLHRLWKRWLVEAVAPQPGQAIVDLAGGTGDVAVALAAPDRCVTVCDPSVAMMLAGRHRVLPYVDWVAGEAEAMPFAENSLDSVTISFGIRNVTRLRDALTEMHRVLKPGGKLFCLEFSKPHAWLAPFYNLFSFQVIPRLGALVANQPEAYAYLVESIRRFPDQEELASLFRDAGFARVTYRNFSFGIVALHIGEK
ncbi:bifunctional demethylmenaquinone methyltransferase/2-methoxy-6-polyprenyl-1,4-benzoquinol methylase UbiE [Rhodoblastus acidophilus]|uniref:Ubiquinone/menaquinone biosynthesis C-methyltransferase UbiE n=1 Tax=Rhodoblastus acidophilus TaxID=1074 RepID=A0A6N8DJG0_RHOAC|nr:bifunctional demethylmenaquinone methyltransferase/2-methoxy-6-polyprenyl-1,4-benzoquinol methylase UbiE [Rhodoblastus acidophilus]MCW2274111.1 demethylmenaquinone methyltransferase/2-methoxy-6-polyprenyl-1,4-benzoquinol methylase [Rhodoblastus acidophilus]MTV30682.1 bifunctional demethylmenaquinone methyltransferase/2-methoxy-6-polyprenyl-1,4-benzoquinol methylase UbiE [Rhodoblastus acidophilus]